MNIVMLNEVKHLQGIALLCEEILHFVQNDMVCRGNRAYPAIVEKVGDIGRLAFPQTRPQRRNHSTGYRYHNNEQQIAADQVGQERRNQRG